MAALVALLLCCVRIDGIHSDIGLQLCDNATSRSSNYNRVQSSFTRLKHKQLLTVGTGKIETLSTNNSAIFSSIYDDRVWSSQGGGSGHGSDFELNRALETVLRFVILRYGILTMLDAPCGNVEHSWMKHALSKIQQDVPCFLYHGVDVVSTVIANNSIAFRNNKKISFSLNDLSSKQEYLPQHYDLLLSRDALQHLSYTDIASVLVNYCISNSKYLLLGSYLDGGANKNIKSGGCFSINLQQEPFNFNGTLEIFAESSKLNSNTNDKPFPIKYLLLFKTTDFCSSESFKFFEKEHRNYI